MSATATAMATDTDTATATATAMNTETATATDTATAMATDTARDTRMKLRIVEDAYAGFEVQVWRWWFPFWTQIPGPMGLVNTFPSVEKAEEYAIKWSKAKVVKEWVI